MEEFSLNFEYIDRHASDDTEVREAGLRSDGELVQAVSDGAADEFVFAPRDDQAAADDDHKDWIPILDISGPVNKGTTTGSGGAMHHDNWEEGQDSAVLDFALTGDGIF